MTASGRQAAALGLKDDSAREGQRRSGRPHLRGGRRRRSGAMMLKLGLGDDSYGGRELWQPIGVVGTRAPRNRANSPGLSLYRWEPSSGGCHPPLKTL
ncbi:hypothetical protein PR202_ga12591 [Eleusine coracana subsp. coracana]|uniref:Uncharacterized protein n=1 Tax=Eleusine coracana subsp. coracana TaxID=191504 RepID=A0AAV5CC47_ELECO|nr:hypothetical protein PR202_ga12591 [Eleusine coracana subsp. coracana]